MNSPKKDLSTAGATVHVAAPPERVWELVSDIHLIASLSQEVQEVVWLDDADGAAPGARFRGRNVNPAVGEWTSVSQVVECDRPHRFTWTVGDPANPTASWSFELSPRDGGTDLTQRYRRGPGPAMLDRLTAAQPEHADAIVDHRRRALQSGIESNLAALTELAQR